MNQTFDDIMGRFPAIDWSDLCDGKGGSCTHDDLRVYILLADSLRGLETGESLITITSMHDGCLILDRIKQALLISIAADSYGDWIDAVMRFQREWQDADVTFQKALRNSLIEQEEDNIWIIN